MMAPAPTPMPMPIFAPVERPGSGDGVAEEDEAGIVELGRVVEVAELPLDVTAAFETGEFVPSVELRTICVFSNVLVTEIVEASASEVVVAVEVDVEESP